MAVVLSAFRSTRPRYELSQQATLAWLAEAHGVAEGSPELGARIERVMARCGCPPSKIARRGFSIPDLGNHEWDSNTLYDLRRHAHGRDSGARTSIFQGIVERYFADSFVDESQPPDDLIHVTCTGYVSPSGAQRLVADRGWPTRVTHAYQMGCYAAVPAVRIAEGFVAARRLVEIVHTEVCSLHFDPTDHRVEQLVVQSLFADGFIRYAVAADDGRAGLRVRAIHERVVPDSSGSMSWAVGGHGMQMTLARDVPQRIAMVLRAFVIELLERGDLDLGQLARCQFAVHPGGPKIIDGVRDVLELSEPQVQTSRAVLLDHGNMSSATLPHIWSRMLDDPQIARGTPIVSLAFGPGLTLCGVLLEKQ